MAMDLSAVVDMKPHSVYPRQPRSSSRAKQSAVGCFEFFFGGLFGILLGRVGMKTEQGMRDIAILRIRIRCL